MLIIFKGTERHFFGFQPYRLGPKNQRKFKREVYFRFFSIRAQIARQGKCLYLYNVMFHILLSTQNFETPTTPTKQLVAKNVFGR